MQSLSGPVPSLFEEAKRAKPLADFITVLLRLFSASAEVFLRYRFGERYFSIARYLVGFVALCIVETMALFVCSLVYLGVTLRGGLNALISNTATDNVRFTALVSFFAIYAALYLIVGALHLMRIWIGNRTGERLHSYSSGTSWFSFLIGMGAGPLKCDEWTIYRFVEPLFLILLGVLAEWRLSASMGRLFAAFIGVFFSVLAFVLLLERNHWYSRMRASMLDRRDAEIASEAELAARRNTQAYAFSVVRISSSLVSTNERWRAALVALAHPDLVAATVRKTLRLPEPQIAGGQARALPVPPPLAPEAAAIAPGEGQSDEQYPFDLATSSHSQTPRALQLLSSFWNFGMAALIAGALLLWLVPNRGTGQAGKLAPTAQAGVPMILPGVGVLPGIGGAGAVVPTAEQARIVEVMTAAPQVPPTAEPARAAPQVPPTGEPARAAQPTAPPASGTASTEGYYNVVTQRAGPELHVNAVRQYGSTSLVIEYTPSQDGAVGIAQPGEASAFYLQSGGKRYELVEVQLDALSRQGKKGEPIVFQLVFDTLPDPSQPFNLVEGAPGIGAHRDVFDIQAQAAPDPSNDIGP